MNKDLPVIIVGAGPVGLSLATALINQGIAVQVFEQCAELSPEARASTFHPRTLEMFAEWDVLDKVLEQGYRVDYLQFWERENRELIAQFDYTAIAADTPYPYRVQCPQSVLTRILKPHIESSPLGSVNMQHKFVEVIDHGDSVTAIFDTPQGRCSIEGTLLCGADGAHSQVRESIGVDFVGMTYRDRFLLVATDIDFNPIFPDLGPVCYIFDPVEWVIVLQLPDVTRVVFRIPEDADERAVQDQAAIRKRIMHFTSSDINYNIHNTAIYNVHQRVASTLNVGRVVLLGDAAHINNPMGGMGMNSGIHDAYSLTQYIKRIYQGESLHILDEYSDLRRDYAMNHIQQSSDKNYRDMSATDEEYREQRNDAFREIANDPQKVRQYLLKRSMLDDRIHIGG